MTGIPSDHDRLISVEAWAEAHDEHCAERYKDLQEAIQSMAGQLKWHLGLMITGLGAMVALLAARIH